MKYESLSKWSKNEQTSAPETVNFHPRGMIQESDEDHIATQRKCKFNENQMKNEEINKH